MAVEIKPEDWNDLLRAARLSGRNMEAKRLEVLKTLQAKYHLKIEQLDQLTLRISKPGKPTIDFTPNTGKFVIINSDKFKTEYLQYFLTLHYEK